MNMRTRHAWFVICKTHPANVGGFVVAQGQRHPYILGVALTRWRLRGDLLWRDVQALRFIEAFR